MAGHHSESWPARASRPIVAAWVMALLTTSLGAPAVAAEPARVAARPATPAARPATLAARLATLVATSAAQRGPAASIVAQPAATSHRLEARYRVDLFLRWRSRKLKLDTTIEVVNTSGRDVRRLELNTVAAVLGGLRRLVVRVDGERVPASVVGQTIRVPLGSTLPVGGETTVEVAFRARLRSTGTGRDFLFTKRNGVAQLYRFIPWISRRIPFGSNAHGEPFLTASSPEVRVSVESDRSLRWATTGRRVSKGGGRRTFVAHDVRDFNIAASPSYRMVSGKSRDGETTITAYTRRHDGRRLVNLARQELARYEGKTGVPYPHRTYRIAETTAGLAMESPALIWIPAARGPADHPFLVSHETAHQWFYAIVGNDQATDAFADEALADYFSRRAHGSIRASRCRRARLDLEIRRYASRCYFEIIYVQGARFLNELRRDFGGRPFRRAIRDYARDNREGIGSNRKLLEAFRARMGERVVKRFRARFPSLY